MILLPNGCRCSKLSVTPRNWKSKNASVNITWKIDYRFYDPGHKPKRVRIFGMNKYYTLGERQAVTEELLIYEMELLQNRGLNPATKTLAPVYDGPVNPSTPFITALKEVLKKVICRPLTLIDIKCVVRGVEKAAMALRIEDYQISDIKRRHIKQVLEYCQKTNPRFSARRHNMYRAYLMKLFKELLELEAIEFNPVRDVSKRKQTRKIRETLTTEQRIEIDRHLKNNYYSFWRFIQIFFHSGGRETELMQVRFEDIDLPNQKYKVLVRKGPEYRWVWKTVKDIALPFWEEIYGLCNPGEYLFSKNLVPGQKPIRPDQVGRRWNVHVKIKLGITADLYSLKHTHTTEMVDMLGDQDAAAMNSHTSTAMVVKIYDRGRDKRTHERLRHLNNPFS